MKPQERSRSGAGRVPLVFQAGSIVELCQRHVDDQPVPPSERLGKAVSRELEYAVLASLEKSRAKRPQTARDLAQLLEKCPAANTWSIDDADAWWGRHERGHDGSSSTVGTRVEALDRTLVTGGPNPAP